MAADRALQLARALHSMSNQIPYEDLEKAATEIAECLSNVLTVRFPSRPM